MAYQVSENTCPVMIRLPMEDAAKLHTLARLRSEETGFAPSMSNQAGAFLHVFLSDVKALPESIAWTEERRKKARAVRAKSDARTKAGAWRKEGWQEVFARRQARLVARKVREEECAMAEGNTVVPCINYLK